MKARADGESRGPMLCSFVVMLNRTERSDVVDICMSFRVVSELVNNTYAACENSRWTFFCCFFENSQSEGQSRSSSKSAFDKGMKANENVC